MVKREVFIGAGRGRAMVAAWCRALTQRIVLRSSNDDALSAGTFSEQANVLNGRCAERKARYTQANRISRRGERRGESAMTTGDGTRKRIQAMEGLLAGEKRPSGGEVRR